MDSGSPAINPSDRDSLLRAYEGSPELRAIFEELLGGQATASIPELAELEQTPMLTLDAGGSGAGRMGATIWSYGEGSHPDSEYRQEYYWEELGLRDFTWLLPQLVEVETGDSSAGSVVAYIRKPYAVIEARSLILDVFVNQGSYGDETPLNARYVKIFVSITPRVTELVNGPEDDYFLAMHTLIGALVRSGAVGPITTPTGLPPQ